MFYGLKVFPATIINEGGKLKKVPIIKSWAENASNDPNKIAEWQATFGDQIKLWGAPTGRINGIVAVDVDIKNGDGFQSLRDNNLITPPTITQTTMSGGKHFIYKYPDNPDVHLGNTAGSYAPNVDTRGEGGWIAVYQLDVSQPIADAPEWLLRGAKKKDHSNLTSNFKYSPEACATLLKQLTDKITEAPVGESNNILNICAFQAGQELLATNSMSREDVFGILFHAATLRGKPKYEATATINSGLDGGMRSGPPQSPFDIQKVESPDEFKRSDKSWDLIFGVDKLRRPQLITDWSTKDIMILSADGGTGKSTLLLNEAIHMALGRRFLGLETSTKGGKTLFFVGEDDVEKYQQMMGRIMVQLGLTNEEKWHVINSIEFIKDFSHEITSRDRSGIYHPNLKSLEKTLKLFESFKFDKVVYDPISSFWGRESDLNDMALGVIKFMQMLKHKTDAGIEMVNHIGKSSTQVRDQSQFAGRGGTALPSHSRVVKTLYSVSDEDWKEAIGRDYVENESGLVVYIGKFSDYSPLMKEPQYISRTGYVFNIAEAVPSALKQDNVMDVALDVVTKYSNNGGSPPKDLVLNEIRSYGFSRDKALHSITTIQYTGHKGKMFDIVKNPDPTKRGEVIIIKDLT